MSLKLGETAPDFKAQTTDGEISFHDYIGDSYCMLFSHPKDFTPVCSTELSRTAVLDNSVLHTGVKSFGCENNMQ